MIGVPTGWICCQLGAREHYATPRGLHRHRRLAGLITDAWVAPGSALRALPGAAGRRLAERHHSGLSGFPVRHFTGSLIAHEALWRGLRRSGWDLFTQRNAWFQRRAIRALASCVPAEGRPVLFAHSYAALHLFRWAKARNWALVLGQIDPGETHFEIVAEAALAAPQYGPAPGSPPVEYLDGWREECGLADRIVVNSEWSRLCLMKAGVPAAKLAVVPLAYQPDRDVNPDMPDRHYPEAFSPARPLRLLFVGHVAVAKGAAALLESLALLGEVPVELTIVGEVAMRVPAEYTSHPAIRWIGAVSRSEVMRRYQEADLLVFPSLSDGFGMAQVEARAWGLPVIASQACGRVVRDGLDGLLLPAVSPEAIATAVRWLATRPQTLAAFSSNAASSTATSVSAMGAALLDLETS
jgi:glycosyltransferase involved in cell wall biosynthesis